MMTKEDEKYYNELFDMFNTPGWKHYQEYVTKIKTTEATLGWRRPTAELAVSKGVVLNLEQLMNFQEEHEAAYRRLQEADES